MKKILLVAADGFSKTGVPTVFMTIIRNLVKEGYHFDIVFFDERFKYYYDEFVSYGGKAFLFDKQYKNRFIKKIRRYLSGHSYFLRAIKLIKQNGPYDAIHCFKEYTNCYFLKAAFKQSIPLRIYHCNNTIKIGGNLLNRVLMRHEKKMCLKYGNSFIGCSSKACDSAFGKETRYQVINNPYDNQLFYFTGNSSDNDTFSLVQTAGFCDNKNQLFTLEVIFNIKKQYPKVQMHFIGFDSDKNYKDMLNIKIEKLCLNDNVIFHPYNVNQKEIFDSCNYFLLPSKREAFGVVLVEAQACGLKCIASDETPLEVELGGCIRLPLSLGPKKWADFILADYPNSKKRTPYDCSSFLPTNFIKTIKKIYEGNI